VSSWRAASWACSSAWRMNDASSALCGINGSSQVIGSIR
jgi:hypothetical protein